jgi:hypothetical protein
MRLKPTKGTIAILGVALGLIVILGGAGLWLLQGRLAEEGQALQARTREMEDGQRIARRQHDARAALDGDRQLIANLEPFVSEPAYVPTLLRQLELLALSTQNRVTGVRPAPVAQAASKIEQRRDPDAQAKGEHEGHDGEGEEESTRPEPYTPLSIEVNLTGRYQNVQRFVESLTRFPKIIGVEQMQIKPVTGTENRMSGLLEVQLKVTAFIMKDETPNAAAVPQAVASAHVAGGVN